MNTNQAFLDNFRVQLNEQDNSSTAEPIFIVYTKKRLFGVNPDYHDAHTAWVADGGDQVITEDDGELFEALEILAESEKITVDGYEYVEQHYIEVDQFRQAFFTRQGAQEYIDANSHKLRKPFIYVDTMLGNNEMMQLRKMLKDGTT